MSDITVEFDTDLEPVTEGEAQLSIQETVKVLQGRIMPVQNARRRGGSIVSDITKGIWNAAVGAIPDQSPTLGQYMETTPHPRGTGTQTRNPNMTLAEKIAQIIPASMRKRSVLEQGDVRALLTKVMMAPGAMEQGETFSINGVEFTANERAAAANIVVEQTEKIKASFAAHVRSNTEDEAAADAAIAAFEADVLYDYRDGVMHSSLPIDESNFGSGRYGLDDDGNLVELDTKSAAGEAATGVDYAAIGAGDESSVDVFRHFNAKEVEDLFATTYDQNTTVQEIYATEAQTREIAEAQGGRVGGNEVSVQYSDDDVTTRHYGLAPGVGGNKEMKSAAVKKAEKLTLTQMANKPKEMDRAQIIALSKRMEAAGIYELIGEKPMVPGDWTDPAFKKGYERLMGLAVEKKVSMMSLLQDRTAVYQKSLEDAMSTRLTDPSRIRQQVDTTAKSMLGRALSPEEHVEFTEFVHNLERRNARVESGLDPDAVNIGGIEDLDEGIVADIDARLSDKIQSDNVEEYSGERVQDQYDMFSNFLAGPGRGGNF